VDPTTGDVYVSWTDPAERELGLAKSSDGTSFTRVDAPGTTEGEDPAIAVSDQQESNVHLAWYDADAQDLLLGTYPSKLDAIAVPAPSTPAAPVGGGGSGAAQKCPKGTVEFVAPPGAVGVGFTPNQVEAPSGSFTACFNNEDPVTHNVAIYKDEAAASSPDNALASDAVFQGPKIDTFDVSGLAAGTYYFHCDVHPAQMKGTLTVK
jgi:plastocyanin